MPTPRPNPTLNLRKIEAENKKLLTLNQTLENEKKELFAKLKESEKLFSSKNTLKRHTLVQEIVEEERLKSSRQLEKQKLDISKLQTELLTLKERYAHLDTIQSLQKDEFNRFLSSSIIDLQSELSSTDDAYEFIVRDVEVEANLLVEQRKLKNAQGKLEQKMVYVLPTSQQLNDIDPKMFNRLKFSLAVVPKE